MVKLYGQGRENENGAEIAAEMRKRLVNEPNVHTIDEIDQFTSHDKNYTREYG